MTLKSAGHVVARAVEGRPAESVVRAFGQACSSEGAPGPGDTVVLALSGGLDSTALFHLMRFAWPATHPAPRLVAAHFDHRMRRSSRADARWVRGLAAAWDIELAEGVADAPLRSEAEARDARYAFLGDVAERHGGATVVTAHHADDQAETVLFRVLRGTGSGGLRGIRAVHADGLWRPLLRSWREELLDYANAVGLGWRDDPTNVDLGYARNALRHRILPDVERLVAPGARRSLVRLSERAARDEEAWDSLLPSLIASLAPEWDARGVRLDRVPLAALHPAVRARVLRALMLELGLRPDARRTRLAVDFAASAESGRSIDLGDGVTLRRDLERLTLARADESLTKRDRPLVIPGLSSGTGEAVLAGRVVWVGWGEEVTGRATSVERFVGGELRFPLAMRAWEPGDRMRTSAGSRKLKRIFLEARIPAPERRAVPVLADAEGEVLWIPGVARSKVATARSGDGVAESLPIGVA
ncbi:MAG: tRNA lysidine(34) synthetase TilS [Gemmatimonadota bacterium]